jgi:septal ring factor EnvC (AmiA/AmiB activator)
MLPPHQSAQLSAGSSSSSTITSDTIDTSKMHDNTFSLEDQNAVLLAEIERVETEHAELAAKHEERAAESKRLRAENESLREELKMLREGKGEMMVSPIMAHLTVTPC